MRGVSNIYRKENVYGKPGKKKSSETIAPESEFWINLKERLNKNDETVYTSTSEVSYRGVRELTPYEAEYLARQRSHAKDAKKKESNDRPEFFNCIKNAGYVTLGRIHRKGQDIYELGKEVLIEYGFQPNEEDTADSFVHDFCDFFDGFSKLNKEQKLQAKKRSGKNKN